MGISKFILIQKLQMRIRRFLGQKDIDDSIQKNSTQIQLLNQSINDIKNHLSQIQLLNQSINDIKNHLSQIQLLNQSINDIKNQSQNNYNHINYIKEENIRRFDNIEYKINKIFLYENRINDKTQILADQNINEYILKNNLKNKWYKKIENFIKSVKKHNIVFISDIKYLYPTAVSISSIINNGCNDNIYYNIYLLITEDVKDDMLNIFDCFNGIVKIIKVKNPFFNIKKEHIYVSKASLLKFIIADIFQDIDKILYLDSDTVIKNNLSELFNTNIDNVYAGVVKDFAGMALQNLHKEMNHKNYFNSGVMYLNLKKIREENIVQKLIKSKENPEYNDKFSDQATLNYIFNENVKYIHLKFNFMYNNNILIDNNYNKAKEIFDIDYNEYFTTQNTPTILHFTNIIKPWNSSYSQKYEEFKKEEIILNSIIQNFKK